MRRILLVAIATTACSPGALGRWHPPLAVPALSADLNRDERIDHALSRLTYGARPGDAQRVRSLGLERWIALQLVPERVDDRRLDSLLSEYRYLSVPTREISSLYRQAQAERRQQQRDSASMPASNDSRRVLQLTLNEVASARLLRAVVSERQLYEQMVEFWENHFNVFSGKGQTRLYIPSYDRDVIRPHALGNFRDLLGAVAKSPAMLFYLDNAQSSADTTRRTLRPVRLQIGRRRGLNENYARELMELHTLGVDGGYTQDDVVNVARALTGWTIEPREGTFLFRPAVHDAEEKFVLGQPLAAGRGIEDGDQVLDILASHPSTARHITRKLAIRFVSDSAPATLVDRCSAVFLAKKGDIRETLQCVVASPEFFSKAAYRAKVKTPYELVVSALRATGGVPDRTPRAAQTIARLGQPIFGRQTPDGWPDQAQEWMNAGAMVNRVNFGLQVASGRMPGVLLSRADTALKARLTSPDFQRR
ncbi:MAG TPA: DUF1800 domain-containing protein [Gemmatimonadaceae bacterium]|nr:DUF1800 domain-containing protein [Gemmatimonadaceae bacterium]